ncbi:MAG: hypothetical protein OXI80_12250 [Caldilineaceae bacterium]|nr:hypothetical protein [Caldilineaceae bacterium]MDE0338435.1 hypothetical protein [Caldilineaceae bacterium]
MYQQQYYVPKTTGTLTDTLLAFGAATLFHQYMQPHLQEEEVILKDGGSYFLIDVGVPVREEWLADSWKQQMLRFVVNAKNKVPDDLAPVARSRSVDETWEKFNQYQALRKQLRDEKLASNEIEQTSEDSKPKPDWTVVTYLGDYRMQAQALHNKLSEQWMRTNAQFPGLNLRTVFELFSSPMADWDAIAEGWKKTVGKGGFNHMVTASQLFNPHMGKGQNRAKANKLTMGNENVFWLLEFLKAVGLWEAAVPTINAGVRKTYILAPREIEITRHQQIFRRFRDRLWNEGVVKQDIMAALLYAEALLEQSIEDDEPDIFGDGGIANVVNGMGVATYQLLSANSYTMMNLAFLGLPDWMPIGTSEDAHQYVAILREHRERIRNIDEDRSEGYALLQLYRDFLSGNYLAPFYEFLAGYGSYLVSALDRSRFYVRPFSETYLRRLFKMTDPELTPILKDKGFRNVADAIRKSTLSLVYVDRRKRRYDIRYGLGQDLRRKAQYKEDFVQELTDFMHSFNDETLRVYERTKGEIQQRKLITTQDIERVVKLVDEHGSKTVCNLLVAFGYARDSREQTGEESKQTDEMEET